MFELKERHSLDSDTISEMFHDGYIRRVKWNTAEILKWGAVLASYPEWADIEIDFWERLLSIEDNKVKQILTDFIHMLECYYHHDFLSSDEYNTLEQVLVNAPKRFLFGFAWIYDFSCSAEKSRILEDFINLPFEEKINIMNY